MSRHYYSYGEVIDLWDRGLLTYDECWDELRDDQRPRFNRHVAGNIARDQVRTAKEAEELAAKLVALDPQSMSFDLRLSNLKGLVDRLHSNNVTLETIRANPTIMLYPRTAEAPKG